MTQSHLEARESLLWILTHQTSPADIIAAGNTLFLALQDPHEKTALIHFPIYEKVT